LPAAQETVSDYVARHIRSALLLAVGSLIGLMVLRTYVENHPEAVNAFPWPQVTKILVLALWVSALRGLFDIIRLPCPRCRFWIGIPWIVARARRRIGRCRRCHLQFDQPVKS
jgi:hypothetical protein